MSTFSTPLLRWLAPGVSILSLTACANFADIKPQAQMLQPSANTQQNLPAVWQSADWPTQIGGAELQRLITLALAQNPGLAIAQSRITAAGAVVATQRAEQLPSAVASAETTYQRFTEHGMVPPPLAGSFNSNNQMQLGASYEFDFWGKHDAALKAALSQQAVAEAELASSRLLIASSVAQHWLQLLRQTRQLHLTQQQLSLRLEAQQLNQQRQAAGLDNQSDLRQAEFSIAGLRAEILQWQEAQQLSRLQLALLLGQNPDYAAQISLPVIDNSASLPELPATLPLDLLANKPEVMAARWRVEAMSAQIDVAKAQFYPNINLKAFVGLSSLGLSKLADSGSSIVGVGPAISLPVFEGGRLRAQLKARTAEFDAAVYSYNQSLQSAMKEAAEQIEVLRSNQAQQQQSELALTAQRELTRYAELRQHAGTGSKIAVLQARLSGLVQEKNLAELQIRQASARVSLLRALGGSTSALN